jgi:hypothetical protein
MFNNLSVPVPEKDISNLIEDLAVNVKLFAKVSRSLMLKGIGSSGILIAVI